MPATLLVALVSMAGMSLPVQTLDGKALIVPRDLARPRSILVISFSKDGGTQAEDWGNGLRSHRSALGSEVYQVAVVETIPRLIRGFVVDGLRQGIPPSLQDRFLLVFSLAKEWRRLADVTDRDAAYVLVLEDGDRIVWRGHGAYSEAMLNELLAVGAARPTP